MPTPSPGRIRLTLAAALAVVALAAPALAASPAAAATWTPISGLVTGNATDAAADGSRVLVASVVDGRAVTITTIAHGDVTHRQVLRTTPRRGLTKYLQVLALPFGTALAVWQDGGRIVSSFRPSSSSRWGPMTTVSAFPGVPTGAAAAPALSATAGGDVIVAWWGGPANGRLGIQASRMGDGGTWGAPVEISAGTYPQLPVGGPPLIAIAAAASPDGGFGVVWRQPRPAASRGMPLTDIAGVTRSAGGVWSDPVTLGGGAVTSFDLTAAAPAPGEVVTAWAESRAQRPDGVTSRTCAVAATLSPSSAVARRDLACHDIFSPGRLRVVPTPGGGAQAAWWVLPDVRTGAPDDTIETYVRAPGLGDWSPPLLTVARVREMEGLATVAGGRSLLLAEVARTPSTRGVRAVLMGADGAVQRRLPGPVKPTAPSNLDTRILPLGPARLAALLLRPAPPGGSRASLLTVGAG